MKQSLEQRKENVLRAIGAAGAPMWIAELGNASQQASVRTALQALVSERKIERVGFAKGKRAYYQLASSSRPF